MILEKDFACREAPPTNAPSISGHFINSSTLSGVTEPPYWIRTDCATSTPYLLVNHARMSACTD